jgi:hypothetical protein
MHLLSTIALVVAALPLEAAIGYPPFLYRAMGHPVTWMGALLDRLEVELNRPGDPPARRRLLGIAALLALLATTISAAAIFTWIVSFRAIGMVLSVVAATSLIAQRSLYDHVRSVADALDGEGLEAGRKAVSMIVGRNTQALDHAGVSRAAIESLAENFSDGVVAPTFWLALGGLPGAAAYKASNTADSMIGHLTPRYAAFGWGAYRRGIPGRLGKRTARRFSAPLAQRRLARGGYGRRTRSETRRSANLWRRDGGRRLHGRWAARRHDCRYSSRAAPIPGGLHHSMACAGGPLSSHRAMVINRSMSIWRLKCAARASRTRSISAS